MSDPARGTPSEQSVVDWSRYYAAGYSLPEIHAHLTNMGHFIAMCRRHFSGQRILEIGTGTGLVSIYFSQLGFDVTGLDSDIGIVQRNLELNARFQGTARFVAGDMFHPPFPEKAFDACFHQGLLEHFDEDRIVEAVRIQTRLARRVIFTVPTRLWRGGTRGDERLWSGTYWRELLHDFRIIKVFGASYADFVSKGMGFLSRRLAENRPEWLVRPMALHRAGEIGFVIDAEWV